MSRKKATNQDNLYSCPVRTRISTTAFERLKKIKSDSNCGSISAVARKILSQEKINCFYRDISLRAPMEELALIRKEIKAIGVNINQQTHYFHNSENAQERAFYVMKTAALYKSVQAKEEQILSIISQLAEKWLPKSKAEKV